MNNDLISREALKIKIEHFQTINPKLSVYDVLKLIDKAPTVLHDNYSMGYQDGVRKVLSERPQGDWIIKDEVICECSLCGYSTNYIRLLSPKRSGLNYCAYCGAKMGKEKKNEQNRNQD